MPGSPRTRSGPQRTPHARAGGLRHQWGTVMAVPRRTLHEAEHVAKSSPRRPGVLGVSPEWCPASPHAYNSALRVTGCVPAVCGCRTTLETGPMLGFILYLIIIGIVAGHHTHLLLPGRLSIFLL